MSAFVNVQESVKEKTETIKAVAKKRGFSPQVILLIAIMLLSIVLSIIVNSFFMEVKFDILRSVAYWLKQAGNTAVSFLLFILAHYTAKLTETNKNEVYFDLKKIISNQYKSIQQCGKNDELLNSIDNENRRRKLKIYRQKINARKIKLNSQKISLPPTSKKKIEELERKISICDKKLETADDDIDFLRVKYVKITYSQIFGGEDEKGENDDDFRVHEGKSISSNALMKISWFFTFGIAFGLLGTTIYTKTALPVIILNITLMLLQFAASTYWGVLNGQNFIRATVINKLRLRIGFITKFCKENAINVEYAAEEKISNLVKVSL